MSTRALADSRRVASMPSMTGIRTSISTRSGAVAAQTRTASAPSEAVPTTARSGWVASRSANADRTTGWSSAMTILITPSSRGGSPRP